MSPAPARSCLARIAAESPTSRAEFGALREKAWIERKFVVLHIDEIDDAWLKQGLKNHATKRWGRRMKR